MNKERKEAEKWSLYSAAMISGNYGRALEKNHELYEFLFQKYQKSKDILERFNLVKRLDNLIEQALSFNTSLNNQGGN